MLPENIEIESYYERYGYYKMYNNIFEMFQTL